MIRVAALGLGIMLAITACGGSAGTAQRPTAPAQTVLPVDWTPAPEATIAPADPGTQQAVPVPKSFAPLSKRAWQRVVKSPDATVGSGYRFLACVTQFDAATGTETFRADASYTNLKDAWYKGDNSMFTGSASQLADYVTGDIVAMSVVNLGSYSYDTQIGGNTTVPMFRVIKIKREKGSCD